MARRTARASTPAAVLRSVRKRLEDDRWPTGLTVLTGDDLYHLDAAQRLLLEALVPAEATEFALTVYGDERIGLPAVLAAARSVGMFSPRRVVLVREVDALQADRDALGALEEYAAGPPPDSFLVVRAPALDQRRKLHKLLVTAGTTVRFERGVAGEETEIAREVARLARERGVEPGRGVIEFLMQAGSFDLYRIVSELDKLADWERSLLL